MNTTLALQISVDAENLPDIMKFQRWVNAANDRFEDAEVCLRIINADEMRKLNHQYRDKDKPTNVLSFAYAHEEGFTHHEEENLLLGDIIFCEDIVEAEAKAQGKTLTDHYAHLTIHGMLHLLGYDHQNNDEAEIMENLEIKILKALGIANPYEVKDKS